MSKTLREKTVGIMLSTHELNKLEQARQIYSKRMGKKYRRATFLRVLAMKLADKIIAQETLDIRFFDSEE